MDLIKQAGPLLAMDGFACTSPCAFNVGLDDRGREEALAARQQARKVQAFKRQATRGRNVLLQNLESSHSRLQQELLKLHRLPRLCTGGNLGWGSSDPSDHLRLSLIHFFSADDITACLRLVCLSVAMV